MNKILAQIWDEIDEIVIHLISITIILILVSFQYFLIKTLLDYLFTDEHFLITYLELTSHLAILILYILSVIRAISRTVKKLIW